MGSRTGKKRKHGLVLAISIFIVITSFLTLQIYKNSSTDDKTKIMKAYESISDTEHVFEKISIDQFNSLIKSKEVKVFIIASPNCVWCQRAIGPLNNKAKEFNINEIYYLESESISREDIETLSTNYGFYGTPYVMVFEDGNMIDSTSDAKYSQAETFNEMYNILFENMGSK